MFLRILRRIATFFEGRWLVVGLALVISLPAFWLIWTKVHGYGFPLFPGGEREEVWIIEAEVRLVAEGEETRVSLGLPGENTPRFGLIEESFASAGFGFRIEEGPDRRAVWEARGISGEQTIYYRLQIFPRTAEPDAPSAEPMPRPERRFSGFFEGAAELAVDTLLEEATRLSVGEVSLTRQLIRLLEQDEGKRSLLLPQGSTAENQADLLGRILARASVQAREARLLPLQDGRRRQPVLPYLEVYESIQEEWQLVHPLTGEVGLPANTLLWQAGGRSLLDLFGAHRGEVRFSMIRDVRPARVLAMIRAEQNQPAILDYSVYGLPVEEQNVFRKLLLIPVGALVLVFLRNFVGLVTAGTFMPVLLALSFMETELIPGLILFALIVGSGLAIRSLLSWLNLLLVPRISAVVVVVICLMAVLSLISVKMDLPQGLTVTFFPLIILAWTIERLSIIWEEEGFGAAMIQGAGSLVAAVAAYALMQLNTIRYLVFAFPEVILILLAVILLMGTYTGYRLSELRRFRPFLERPRP